jgi:hypothetical protein
LLVASRPGNRSHIDDHAATGGKHRWDLVLHAVEGAIDVRTNAEREAVGRDLGKRRWHRAVRGVVYGEVESTELFDAPLDQPS